MRTAPQAGFTVIELLVALTILGIAMATVMSAMLANTNMNTSVEKRANAVRISEQLMEAYRQRADYGTMRLPVTESITRNGRAYTAVTTFCPIDLPPATRTDMPCNNTSVYIRIEVKDGSTVLQKVETYFTQFGSES
ncbi:type IV pilus modification PilV family protein [Deinococcus kurensis]|uniref:type IV pilus modification PilV family protein n=1 Tax=Deinococcus kurensis TaxID=2662757 RepID=UPI001391AC32|nr:type II secretion system protein [Deinococcus kurensis]